MPPLPGDSGLPQATRLIAYGGFWLRLVAWVLDGLLIASVRGVILLPLGLSLLQKPFRTPWFYLHAGEAQIYSVTVTFCYFVFFWTVSGATPGKMLLRLKVTMADGSAVGLQTAVVRCFAQLLSGMILCLGFIMAGLDNEKRALHDRLAGTRVIRT